MKKIRVLIVEDHPFFRSGLAQWLNQQERVTCCGEAGSVREARQAIADSLPDVILMDLRLGDGEGLDLIAEITQAHPHIRSVALSQFDEDIYAHRAMQAGARGYLMKSEATESVLAAIQTVMGGGIHLSPGMAAKLLQNIFPDPASRSLNLARLSNRELQVFQLLGGGLSTIEIGKHLKLSPKTVETYREHLKDKLGLADAPALLRAATLWVESGRLEAEGAADPRQKG
ncbi:MAG: DNA-binding response regulator [Verrucomicrobiales bacterium VVV1]|nr:MAG: DNA-binding response regulator [Verrucomicrobiales bacterium VVV1]